VVAAIHPPEPSKDPNVEDLNQARSKGPRYATHQSPADSID
jgi:hypothetical protein